jgi:hypothetical protein
VTTSIEGVDEDDGFDLKENVLSPPARIHGLTANPDVTKALFFKNVLLFIMSLLVSVLIPWGCG